MVTGGAIQAWTARAFIDILGTLISTPTSGAYACVALGTIDACAKRAAGRRATFICFHITVVAIEANHTITRIETVVRYT